VLFITKLEHMQIPVTNHKHKLHDHLKEIGVEITFYQDEGFGWVLKFIDLNGNMWGVIQITNSMKEANT
jgi:hypothetical protein